MSSLHKALEALGPRDYSDIPLDELPAFLNETFAAALEIVDSVPRGGDGKSNGSAKSGSTFPALAQSAADMVSIHTSAPPVDAATQKEAKCWGKPLKLGAKENPLELSVYKMAANDRHGAWFARRSVHRGMAFDKWRSAMKHEFAESLGVVGGPGAGSVRGIAADNRLERQVVEGVGALEVWHLSAQFPGPTAPRDFVICLLCSDTAKITSKSEANDNEHYMVVSIPVDHPEAKLKDGLVRGQYESVEIIRRIPDWDLKSKSSVQLDLLDPIGSERANKMGVSDSHLPGSATHDATDLVEWIMITRSDPGGGIPRFMVERGTPSSITSDAVKFLDWATSKENVAVDTDEIEAAIAKPLDENVSLYLKRTRSDRSTFEPSKDTDTGVISSLTSMVRSYAPSMPQAVSNMMPGGGHTATNEESDNDSDSSSMNSFASAEQFTTAEEYPSSMVLSDHLRPPEGEASSTSSLASNKSTDSTLETKLAKLEEKRKSLDSEYDKLSKREEAKAQEALTKEAKEAAKIKDRLERERKKREARYSKEMKRLEAKREREERKAEERRLKTIEGDTIGLMKRERDQAKRMAEVLKQENVILRQRVGDLQRENTLIVQRVSKLSGGRQMLRDIKSVPREDQNKSGVQVNLQVPGSYESGDGTPQASLRSTSPVETTRSSASSITSGGK